MKGDGKITATVKASKGLGLALAGVGKSDGSHKIHRIHLAHLGALLAILWGIIMGYNGTCTLILLSKTHYPREFLANSSTLGKV